MNKVLRGRVWRFEGIMDVDEQIYKRGSEGLFLSGDMTYEEKLKRFGELCLITVDPDFPKKVHKGDFVVGGPGFGFGHDHEQACIALRGAGVGAVLVEAVQPNFQRNSIAHGLPVIEVKGIMSATKTGDELEVDLDKCTVKNLKIGKALNFKPYTSYILDIIEAGGVYQLLKKQVKSGLHTSSRSSKPKN